MESCNYVVANSNRDFTCVVDNEGKWLPWSRRLGSQLPVVGFDTHYDCLSRISNVHENKLCVELKSDKRFHIFDVTTGDFSEESYGNVNNCYEDVNGE